MRLPRIRVPVLAAAIGISSLLLACADEPASVALAPDGARIISATSGALTGPSTAPSEAIVHDFLRARGARVERANLRVTSTSALRDDIYHVRLEEVIGTRRVVGAYVKVALSGAGEILHIIENVLPVEGAIAAPTVDERAALQATLRHLGYQVALPALARRDGTVTRFSKDRVFHREPSVEQVVYADALGSLQPGFLVETWSTRGNLLDHTLVDGLGAIVSVERRTNNDSYRVFALSPLQSSQEVIAGDNWVGTGPQTSTNISGNNARAYLDGDANNAPDTGGASVSDGNFLAVADFLSQPGTAANRAVAVQNLFYLNNILHDVLKGAGFDEAQGNFQVDNFGNGGVGGDPVNAEAQDGSGIDNANFATPNDGSSPRMQMYLWSSSNPSGLLSVECDGGAVRDVFTAGFGPALTLTGVTGPLALFADKKVPTSDGCSAANGSFAGKVAIIDRGNCDFDVKVLNAQRAGAIGVIVANNVPGEASFAMTGTSGSVTIPSIMVTQAEGEMVKSQGACPGRSATLRRDPVESIMLDASLDFDIVAHEYGHGLTWRMIGNMSGALPGAVGEGASDVLAFLLNGDDRVGEYSASSAAGIRRYPYSGYPLRYGAVTGAGVHKDGEIYAAAMWRVLELYRGAGLTADQLLGDFVQGMNFTPPGPYFEHMRDGMLAANTNPVRECLIWKGFAELGIGSGARASVSRRGVVSIVESRVIPTGVCLP